MRSRIDTAVDALDGAIRELRNYIFRLRPQEAASLGMERGLVELAREYEVNVLARPTPDVASALDAEIPQAMARICCRSSARRCRTPPSTRAHPTF